MASGPPTTTVRLSHVSTVMKMMRKKIDKTLKEPIGSLSTRTLRLHLPMIVKLRRTPRVKMFLLIVFIVLVVLAFVYSNRGSIKTSIGEIQGGELGWRRTKRWEQSNPTHVLESSGDRSADGRRDIPYKQMLQRQLNLKSKSFGNGQENSFGRDSEVSGKDLPDIGLRGRSGRQIKPVLNSNSAKEYILNSKLVSLQTSERNVKHPSNRIQFGRKKTYNVLIQNENICDDKKKVRLLIAVASAHDHFSARRAIRRSWGSYTALAPIGARLLFLLGSPPHTEDGVMLQRQIIDEATLYGDIIQEDFLDTYLNLTLKTIMGLKWAAHQCPTLKYFMKADDDIFINVPKLNHFLTSQSQKQETFIVGCVKQRKAFSPVNLPPGLPELPPAHPLFVAGAGYVITGDLLPRLYGAAQHSTVIVPVEDVYVTGHLAKAVGAHPPLHHEGFTCGELLADDCDAMQMFTGHKITPERMQQIWHKINPQDYSSSPCFDF